MNRYLANPALTATLEEFVTVSSLPLKGVETDFAVDASTFSISRFVRWHDHKYNRETRARSTFRCHLVCGVKIKIITAVDISGWIVHDSYFFVPLVTATARNFDISEVAADMVYSGRWNREVLEEAGGTPYIPFESNNIIPIDDSIWAKMYHLFTLNREGFVAHYHKRSNAESVFSMTRSRIGDAVRSKSDLGQVHEVLAKVLCHNMCVLIRAAHDLGVEP